MVAIIERFVVKSHNPRESIINVIINPPNANQGGTKMVAIIDKEKCDGCGTCVEACPSEAISIGDDEKAKVNEEECVDCESCVDECPNQAISMSEE